MSDDHYRKRLPDTRRSVTHRVAITSPNVGGPPTNLYIRLGYYDDGPVGEIFCGIGKQGSTLSGVLDAWAIMTSIGLQYGVPLDAIVNKNIESGFEPAGSTSSEEIPTCTSPVDYACRYLSLHRDIGAA